MAHDPQSVVPTRRIPIAILGVPFDNVTVRETLEIIGGMIASRHPHYAATANVDFVVQALEDAELRHILFNAHLVLADGQPLVWASRFLGNPLPERVTGSGMVPLLLELAEAKGWRVFFLGGTEQSVAAAAEKTRAKHPKLQLVGAYSPPFKPLLEMDHEDIIRRVHEAKPDILLVAFGCPKQEKWAAMNYRCANVPFVVGVGATIDFLAGTVRRAPVWMQKTGLEWIFRLLQEPRRLAGRYGKGLRVFSCAIFRQWRQMRARPGRPELGSPSASTQDIPGCTLIKSPPQLDAAAAKLHLAAWQKTIENSDVIFDLGVTTTADSSGMGALIRLGKVAREYGHKLVLLSPQPKVLAAMALMKLTEFFTIETNTDGARQRILTEPPQSDTEFRRKENLVTLSWRGEITAANARDLLAQAEFDLAAAEAGARVTLDLSQVKFVDSTGLGVMIQLKKRAWQRDVAVVFKNPGDMVRSVMRLTKVEEYLLDQPK